MLWYIQQQVYSVQYFCNYNCIAHHMLAATIDNAQHSTSVFMYITHTHTHSFQPSGLSMLVGRLMIRDYSLKKPDHFCSLEDGN